jgi:hypothetical protein
MSGVKVGEHYFLKSNAHVFNEKLYFVKGLELMLQQIIHSVVQFFDKRKKIMQFALIFHLLSHGHPMTKYTTMQTLFVELNVPNNHMKHWFHGFGWEMTNCMFEQVLNKLKLLLLGQAFFI